MILAFVDLDNFKDINDTFGHHMGDEVLIEVGARLRRVVRAEDLIARFGGDEFVILVKSAHDPTDAHRLVERIWAVARRAVADDRAEHDLGQRRRGRRPRRDPVARRPAARSRHRDVRAQARNERRPAR